MLGQRRRRWTDIVRELDLHLVFYTGMQAFLGRVYIRPNVPTYTTVIQVYIGLQTTQTSPQIPLYKSQVRVCGILLHHGLLFNTGGYIRQ